LQDGSDTRNQRLDKFKGDHMIEAEWWEYDSLDELADAVAGDVGFIVESAVDARDAALIAVPGGKTGPAIFPKLAAQQLPWKKVAIIPTDDRLVPMDSDLSNVREIARTFLSLGARVVPIATEIADYKLAGNSADARLQDLGWPPDLVWLGVGADGHTASIFAGPDMQAALDAPKARRAIGVMPDPLPAEAPVPRVTLTRAAILSARTILITITGQEKREVLEQAIADGQSSHAPIGRVLAEAEHPIDIHWCP
jgi:6-phosphogluconolactonase